VARMLILWSSLPTSQTERGTNLLAGLKGVSSSLCTSSSSFRIRFDIDPGGIFSGAFRSTCWNLTRHLPQSFSSSFTSRSAVSFADCLEISCMTRCCCGIVATVVLAMGRVLGSLRDNDPILAVGAGSDRTCCEVELPMISFSAFEAVGIPRPKD